MDKPQKLKILEPTSTLNDNELDELNKKLQNAIVNGDLEETKQILDNLKDNIKYSYCYVLYASEKNILDFATEQMQWDILLFILNQGNTYTIENEDLKFQFLNHITQNAPSDNVALYNIIKTKMFDLFELYTKQKGWNDIYLKEILPPIFDDISIKNMELSNDFIENILDLRFYSDPKTTKLFQDKQNLDEVKMRINNTIYLIENLNNYGKDINLAFLITGRYIAQNINILKNQLVNSHKLIPWEQIEFCLCIYLKRFLKNDQNISYKLVLNKERVLLHLNNLKNILVNYEIEEFERKVQNEDDDTIKEVFSDLLHDFNITRSIYSLMRIKEYVDASIEVDLDQNEDVAKLVIERTLQVMGEYMKNTAGSPNISTEIRELIISVAPRYICEFVTNLRDSLSHVQYKIEVEYRNDQNLFQSLQDDIKKISFYLIKVLNKLQLDSVIIFANRCKNASNVQVLIEEANLKDLDQIYISNYFYEEYKLLQNLIEEFSEELIDKDEKDEMELKDIKRMLKEDEKNFQRSQNVLNDSIRNLLELIPENISNYINSNFYEETKFSSLIHIYYRLDSIFKKSGGKQIKNLNNILYKIFLITCINSRQVNNIIAFTNKFNNGKKKNKSLENKKVNDFIQTKIDQILEKIDEEQKQNFSEEYSLKRRYFELNSCIKSKQKFDQEEYDKIRSKLNKSKNKKKNPRDDYEILFNSVRKSMITGENKLKASLPTFLSSLECAKVSKLIDIVNDIFKSEDKSLEYFSDKLKILGTLLNEDNKESEIAIEMLLLDILEVLKDKLVDNKLIFDDYFPTINGKQIRNYLAHGGILVDLMPIEPKLQLNHVARNIFKSGLKLFNNEEDILVGYVCLREMNEVLNIQSRNIFLAVIQDQMFQECKLGSTSKIEECTKLGADLFSRDFKKWNGLHFAASGDNAETFLFLRNQGILIDTEDIDAITPLNIAARSNSCKIFKSFSNENLYLLNKQNSFLFDAVETGKTELLEFLLEQGADPNFPNNADSTPIHLAAFKGYERAVQILIRYGAKITYRSVKGSNAFDYAIIGNQPNLFKIVFDDEEIDEHNLIKRFHTAAMLGSNEAILFLLSKGVKIDSTDSSGWSALFYASAYGKIETSDLLLTQNAFIDLEDNEGDTPLSAAAGYGQENSVDHLLKKGAKINHQNNYGLGPLHRATSNNHYNIVKTLLEEEASIDLGAKERCTALYLSAQEGYNNILKLLIDNGAEINKPNQNDWRPLHIASQFGHIQTVNLLLENGADILLTNQRTFTALHIAAMYGHPVVIEQILNYARSQGKLSEVLNAQTIDKCTPLFLTSEHNNEDALKALLKWKPNIDLADGNGCTPLYIAAQNNSQSIVQILVEHEADFKKKNDNECSPFYMAVQLNNIETIRYFFQLEIDVNEKNVDDSTPLNMACFNANEEVIDFLLKNDADVSDNMALYTSAIMGHYEIVEKLWKIGARFDLDHQDEFVTLCIAVQFNNENAVNLLIEKGEVDINSCNVIGWTPLCIASYFGFENMVKLLLQHGAKLDCDRAVESLPVKLALKNGHQTIINIIFDWDFSKDFPNFWDGYDSDNLDEFLQNKLEEFNVG